MLQVGMVVELLILGLFASVWVSLFLCAFGGEPALAVMRNLAARADEVFFLCLIGFSYVAGIIVNFASFGILNRWYRGFRQEHFHRPYFKVVGAKEQVIPDEKLWESTIAFLALKAPSYLPRFEFFHSLVRILRGMAFNFLLITVSLFFFWWRFPAVAVNSNGLAAIFPLLSVICIWNFRRQERWQYERLLAAFSLARGERGGVPDPHQVI